MTDPKIDYRIGEPTDKNESDTNDSENEVGHPVGEELELPLRERETPESYKERLARRYREAQRKILENPKKSPWSGTSGWNPDTLRSVNQGRKN